MVKAPNIPEDTISSDAVQPREQRFDHTLEEMTPEHMGPIQALRPTGSSPLSSSVPLCTNLNGTLIRTDTLWESLVTIARTAPLQLFSLFVCLSQGKAAFKRRASQLANLDVTTLPYRQEMLAFLEQEKARSRTVILATGEDQILADRINEHLHVFDQVIGSDGVVNLTKANKNDELVKRFGAQGFVYLGDAAADKPLWRRAVEGLGVVARALRVHHWAKNVLVLLPILLHGHLTEWHTWIQGIIAATALSLAASGTYLINDMLDLASDRRHPVKRFRPLAAGTLSISTGILLVVLLLVSALALSTLLSVACTALVAAYAALSLFYSLTLKKMPIMDVVFLAGLYTFRIFLGGQATGIPISKWTMLFSVFTFTSLAFLKRFAELKLGIEQSSPESRRGYASEDLSMVGTFGIVSGYLGALVFVLYLNSPEVLIQYSRPDWLWLACPLLIYWTSHVWLIAQRGKIDSDPVVFASRDKTSYAVFGLIIAILCLAH